ncbi:hypothetical protein D187_010532 [Cystobacter fuscus DSM 2262]|uniref:Uncharacterized protein n=1 Tax=Cystobacter fuscus (strain ATCC 25194 / DSM 2262 / NBRC 100088 / M29) TaxID=1242864 RepID=S9QZ10_CYSF2|nr:hypothetical protein D187_010532 [Cystobacter fuscus DSM 2262]
MSALPEEGTSSEARQPPIIATSAANPNPHRESFLIRCAPLFTQHESEPFPSHKSASTPRGN